MELNINSSYVFESDPVGILDKSYCLNSCCIEAGKGFFFDTKSYIAKDEAKIPEL